MSRVMKVMVALLAIAIFAAPAMAEIKLNGYFRVQGEMDNFSANGLTQTKDDTSSVWNQRFRLKMSDTLNENVTLVYYAEADTDWGQSDKLGNNGAKLGNDGVLIETKQAYADLKFDAFTSRVGLQGFYDGLDGLYFDDDGAGITVNSKMGMADLTLLYGKFDEGAMKNGADDFDFYGVKAALKASDQVNVGADAYYFVDGAHDIDTLILALTGGVQLSDALALDGFFVYTDASAADKANEGNSWLANVALKAKLGDSGSAKLRVLYAPADDSATDDDNVPEISEFGFAGENLMIIGTDGPATNAPGGGNYVDALNNGYGLLAVVLSGSYSLPEAAYLKYGAGYFAAADDTIDGAAVASKDGTELGTEVALTIGKKVLGNVDLSLRGSYLFTGDFYGKNAEDAWQTVSMLNISF